MPARLGRKATAAVETRSGRSKDGLVQFLASWLHWFRGWNLGLTAHEFYPVVGGLAIRDIPHSEGPAHADIVAYPFKSGVRLPGVQGN